VTEPYMLYLMRHGAPVREGLLLGRTDEPVTGAGVAACRARVELLDPLQIFSSDLARAVACAAAVSTRRGIEVVADARLRELDFGDWDGLRPDEVDPSAFARFHEDPDAAPPPGGERWSALQDRVGRALDAIPPAASLVVTHGGAIRAALAHLCGFDRPQLWAFDLPYAALVSLRIWPGAVRTVQIVGLAT
jgi:alpha-ribazole phosphatase